VFQGNARGFGFLLMEDGNDLFVPASKTHGAFHRDVVLFRRVPNTKDEAEVVSIISRGTTELVGTYDTTNNTRFVLPDDKKFVSDVYVSPKKHLGAKHGQKVVVKIIHFPSDNRNSPEGEIVQVLGFPDEKNVDMLSVAHSFGLSREFPQNVEARVSKIPQTVDEKSLVGRRDLRNHCIFTIDGDDAKDLDDAVSISTDGVGNFVLGVHIADVSHYVKPGDDVDKEAFNRGTSVYFPETVFPMLPTALSNGICSLFQGVDRLTLSCQMTVNARGKVVDYEIFPSVINSCRRMTYANVQRIFDGDKGALAEFSDVVAPLMQMKQLAEILQNKRSKRGNIDFVSKEVYFVHDNDGNVVDVLPYPHSFANQLIEEFMILANETVAEFAQVCDYPFVYRIHEKPDEQKLAVLYSLMAGVGISVKHSQEVHSSVLQDALAKAEGTPYFNLINDVMLRTMQKAKYSTFNSRHFGLASNCY
ncbi:MAG: VacB/RNase II family 3'-5' exoribonuclease, partial [Clostridia bacterium]|nr:VacB/RNase II family 3'-5' exoribonuclease [Clostridia bacterium]